VLAEKSKVMQILINLISNARHACIEGGAPTKVITLAIQPAGERVRLSVQDNGIGIAPEHHQIVFRMFKRLHAREDFGGGMGAGLAFVKKIVERHRGITWIEAAPGGGTTVCFTLGRALHAVHAANSDC
jgi:signal transduction histidine kinase